MMKITDNTTTLDDDSSTVLVTVINNNKEAIWCIQTHQGEHRIDLGCEMSMYNGEEYKESDYQDFEIEAIISHAEKYIASNEKITDTIMRLEENGGYITIIESFGECYIVEENPNFINKDTSSYQCKYSDEIMGFENINEANEWLSDNCI